MRSLVIVRHDLVGFHRWPAAPTEVEYLAAEHRHLFKVVVAWQVHHQDRQIEFHTAQNWVRYQYGEGPRRFGAMSCEMIGADLAKKLVEAGHPQPEWVEVWEDGECGARIEFDA